MSDISPNLPPNEQQWKRLFQKSEARSAKFGELLETLHEHPQRDDIIDHEMGWDRDPAAPRDEEERRADEELIAAFNAAAEEHEDAEWREMRRAERAALAAMPAYARGFEWGLAVRQALKPILNERPERDSDELDPDDPRIIALGDSMVVAARLAGAHAMGEEDETLCGNIVCCLQSLEAAQRSLAAIEALAEQQKLPARGSAAARRGRADRAAYRRATCPRVVGLNRTV